MPVDPATLNVDIPNLGVGGTTPNSPFWRNLFFGADTNNPRALSSSSDPAVFISNWLSLLLVAADIVAIVFVLMSAWQLFTSGGDTAKYETAKKSLITALTGAAIIMAMLFLIQVIKGVALGTF